MKMKQKKVKHNLPQTAITVSKLYKNVTVSTRAVQYYDRSAICKNVYRRI